MICPTVLARTPEEYDDQIETIRSFADRIQIDLGDGDFTSRTVDIGQVWWPETVSADIHLMYRRPAECLAQLIALKPELIIIHAESEGDIGAMLTHIRHHGILAGIALLQDTVVDDVAELVRLSDHVLIFSGSLGSFGGVADLSLLGKVPQIRTIHETVEIGWDGGANQMTAVALSDGGVDVLNVGGAIQKANHPENAYRALVRALRG